MRKNILKSMIAGVAALVGLTGSVDAVAQTPARTSVTHPEWSRNAVIYEVNLRQFTPEGTINAFVKELPRLKELGVDILWFMPIHPISEKNRKGELGSYYAVKDYKAVNPEFGTLDEFKHAVNEAHKLGMKVVIDWVPNHTGCDNAWVTEHPEWYSRNKNGEMYGPFDWTDVYELNYDNYYMRKAMVDALKFWLTEVGIDGYRCDVAMEVPTDFWDDTRPQLQAVKPDLFMLAEASVPELQLHGFDMGYNWPMKDLWSEIATTSGQYTFQKEGEPMKTFPTKTAVAIDSLLADQAAKYPIDSYLMNMVTNHDLNSWEGTEFDRLGNLNKAFAVLSYTLPGMPLIYTGQETGMNRAFEFFKKDNAPQWEPRNEYFTFYQTLNRLKHENRALLAGEKGGKMVRCPTTSNDLYVFSRTVGDDSVLVMVNLGAKAQKVKFTGEAPSIEGMTNIFDTKANKLPKKLNPGEYQVWAK